MKILLYLAFAAGLGLAIGLVVYFDFHAIAAAMLSAGWGLLAVTAFHMVPMTFSAAAWAAVAGGRKHGLPLFLWARCLRESVSNLLPVAHVGGDVAGARVLTLHGVAGGRAGASVIVDMTTELFSQFAFTLIGVGLLALVDGYSRILYWVLAGLAVGAPVLLAFYLLQRWGLVKALDRLIEKLAAHFNWQSLSSLSNMHDTMRELYRDRRAVAEGFLNHLLSWLTGAGEIWLALHFMGVEPTVAEAIVLESLSQAIKSVAFVVPAALGVQEGGFILLGGLFGIHPDIALALSLVRRVRELAYGIPSLVAWQWVEGRRVVAAARAGK